MIVNVVLGGKNRNDSNTDWFSSSAVSNVSGVRCTAAQRTRSADFGSDRAVLTAAASIDASYARRVLIKDSAFILNKVIGMDRP
jgi:hypothetical protein